MSTSVVASAAVMGLAMVILLAVLTNFVVTYVATAGRLLELSRYYRRPTLLIGGARVVGGGRVVFNVTNQGPESVIVDSSTTLLLDYQAGDGSGRVTELLSYGTSWYVEALVVGGSTYPVTPGAAVEVKPGATARVVATVGGGIAPGSTVILVLVDRWGSRAEYVFAAT
jgi:hypothetical protein